MRRVVSLWLPRFATELWRCRRSGGGPADPLALVAPENGRLVLAAVDAAAAGGGLSPGLPLADARALLPGLRTAAYDPQGNAAALARLAEWCGRYTPWTAVDGCGCDLGGAAGLLLDVTGCSHFFAEEDSDAAAAQGETGLLADMTARLARLGFTVRAGLAGSVGAAWAVARFGPATARDAARHAMHPWRVVAPGRERIALAPLPPAALRLPPATVELLARFGLDRIGALYDLPPARLTPRFGPLLARRLAQALGGAPGAAPEGAGDPISPLRPVPPHLVRHVFAEPVIAPGDIARALDRLLAALARRLEAAGLGARRLELGLYRVDGTLRRFTLGTSRPRRDPARLARLFAPHLERLDPGFGLEVMTLAAAAVEDLAPRQLDLEAGATASAGGPGGGPRGGPGDGPGEALAALIDRLGARLGLAAVQRPQPRESHLPERAVALTPIVQALIAQAPIVQAPTARPSGTLGNGTGWSWVGWSGAARPHPPRPLRLLPRPEPIEAVALPPALLPDQLLAAPPARFRWRRLARRVVRAEGPERIAPEWWRNDPEAAAPARDYFRVEDEDGRRYWLYRSGTQWFLHGLFG